MSKNNGSVILSLLISIPLLVFAAIGVFLFGLDHYSKAIFYRNIEGNYYRSFFRVYYRSSQGGLGIFPNIKYVKVEGARNRYFSVLKDRKGNPSEYGRDDKNVFYRERKLEKADVNSFIALTSVLGRDKNAYFLADKPTSEYLRGASDIDVDDKDIKFHYFNKFDPYLIEISSKYYVIGGYPYLFPLDIIDYESFTPDVVKKRLVSGENQYSLGKDKNFEYFFNDRMDKLLSVRRINDDINVKYDVNDAFVEFEGKLYLNGRLANDSYKSGSLRKLKNNLAESKYYKDNMYVYYKDRQIKEADSYSFKVIVNTRQIPGYSLEYIAEFAVDKDNKYHMGNRITPDWPMWEREFNRAMESFKMYIE